MEMMTFGVLLFFLALTVGGCQRSPGTELAQAATVGDTGSLASLLSSESDVDEFDSAGLTPLMWAARAGQLQSIETLIQAGADPNLADRSVNGWSALQHAIHKRHARAAILLLERGARPDFLSENGTSSLMLALGECEVDVVKALLRKDPSLRLPTDVRGFLAIEGARADGCTEAVELVEARP